MTNPYRLVTQSSKLRGMWVWFPPCPSLRLPCRLERTPDPCPREAAPLPPHSHICPPIPRYRISALRNHCGFSSVRICIPSSAELGQSATLHGRTDLSVQLNNGRVIHFDTLTRGYLCCRVCSTTHRISVALPPHHTTPHHAMHSPLHKPHYTILSYVYTHSTPYKLTPPTHTLHHALYMCLCEVYIVANPRSQSGVFLNFYSEQQTEQWNNKYYT